MCVVTILAQFMRFSLFGCNSQYDMDFFITHPLKKQIIQKQQKSILEIRRNQMWFINSEAKNINQVSFECQI